ncbi:MAG: hypothetical protein MZV65_23010 [Chromatiales bacterium]|nr:hypothetical protein [Chromatiales bacterium]
MRLLEDLLFHQMRQQDNQLINRISLLACAYAFDVFGQVIDVGFRPIPRFERIDLLLSPGMEIDIEKLVIHSK